jgi:chromate transporter
MDKASTGELFRIFSRLSVVSFGGPAAHIALMRDEAVDRKKWFDDQRFLDMVGLTNLIPGPNSTEMAMHIGHDRAGWRGLLVAGSSFILPASLIALGFAWAFRTYGQTPAGESLLRGIKPVVVVIVIQALIKLLGIAIKGWVTGFITVAAVAAYLFGVNELLILGAGTALVVGLRLLFGSGMLLLAADLPVLLGQNSETELIDLGRLFLVFLKAGAFLYGSGYVLAAFLHNDLVVDWAVLSETTLLDAIAIGQMLPGPLFTTATFIGFYLAGVPGAIIATTAIFLPSFIFVGAIARMGSFIRERPRAAIFLDGVNAASLGLMVGVTWQLADQGVNDILTLVLAGTAALALWKTRLNPALLIVAGGSIGVLAGAIGV